MAPPYFGGAGSAGGSGGGSTPLRLSYHHRQDAASALWVIAHGLGFRPAGIQVADQDGNPVEGIATHPDLSTVHLHFDLPIAGTADLS